MRRRGLATRRRGPVRMEFSKDLVQDWNRQKKDELKKDLDKK